MIAKPAADAEFAALTDKISRERGFGCASYKEKCLRRRIAVRMRARGVHSYADYARVLDTDSAEYERLIDALTINVTKLFRNWETYETIGSTVIPRCGALPDEEIIVWSAGCSSGEEPYSSPSCFHSISTPSPLASCTGSTGCGHRDRLDRESLGGRRARCLLVGGLRRYPLTFARLFLG